MISIINMPINYPELLVLLVLHLHWYHALGFLPSSSSGSGFVGESRADTSSAKHQTSSSTSYLTSNNIVASSSPELGGDIIRIRTSPDDDEDSFLSRAGT